MNVLKKLLEDHQLFHTKFQQDNFITNRSGGTMYGQYKQALRELYKRVASLRESICNHKILEIEIKKKERIIDNDTIDELDLELAKVEYIRKTMQSEESVRSINDAQKEFERFYRQAILLNGELTEKHGELTSEVKDRLDMDMWMFKAKEMIALDYLANRSVGRNTFEFVISLPMELRDSIIKFINNPKDTVKWFQDGTERYQLDQDKLSAIRCDGVNDFIGISLSDTKGIT